MALTIDPAVGGASSNAYADVAAATTVATYRVGGSAAAWLALTPDQKIQTLVTATRDIDALLFKGARATGTQALEWPRTGTAYASTIIPAPIIAATIELAFSYATAVTAGTDVLNPDTATIKREKVGEIETEYFTPSTPLTDDLTHFPLIVQRLLAPLVWIAAASGWGNSLAVRTS